jgi:hypothetical protein
MFNENKGLNRKQEKDEKRYDQLLLGTAFAR